jgi:hypothetical protein
MVETVVNRTKTFGGTPNYTMLSGMEALVFRPE